MSKSNNGSYYTEEERNQMAEAYLTYGTFRCAANHSRFSKSTIHKVVNNFIANGEYFDTGSLRELVEKNKKECALRGGIATAAKWKSMNG